MTTMQMADTTPTEKREALEEVLRSETFVRADQLRSFLRYICEMEIAGRGGELCESLIGVEAFGRPADYSPTEDASVRRRAVDLREKLQQVYDTELVNSSVRIELPKGKYVPRFVRTELENGIPIPGTITSVQHTPIEAHPIQAQPIESAFPARFAAAANRRRRLVTFWFAAGWVVGALMVSAGFVVYLWLRPPATPPVAIAPTAVRPITVESGVTYEAEAPGNTFSGKTYAQICPGCSGNSRVRHIGNGPYNYLVFNNIAVTRTGNYEMIICYVLEGNRSLFIKINDDPPIQIPVQGASWQELSKISITVPLKAGSNNRIKFYNEAGYAPDLDRIVIR